MHKERGNDRFWMEDWLAVVHSGSFTDTHGYGMLATENYVSDDEIKPSDPIEYENVAGMKARLGIDEKFTHIEWYSTRLRLSTRTTIDNPRSRRPA